ncbi:MAG TPA: UDP-2,3-diacylglucosamine diphosphatase [Burkholderiaceae bacterium]|jgi:UDP-2,3-diacylglucosamine pyrophosphatase LpxH|nr:UDP-2,3-diacylglucosamine diphosphatase [Burkholderiaceae bacterium]
MARASSNELREPLARPRAQTVTTAGAAPVREAVGPPRYRAIFISDTHLGTRGCKAQHLLDFLRHHESDYLYLVGDVIDGWALRSGFYWPQSHNDVVQKVLRRARKGARVVYIPGNHDEFARQFVGLDFGGIAIRAEAEHRLLDGRRLWVVHGDFADGVIQHARWLAFVGDAMYGLALWLNHYFNAIRARLGFGYWSLSQYLKHKVKNAVSFICGFEQVLVREAQRRGYDGVICGHIHRAEIRIIDGLLYCNDGDWVESLTALVESLDGELRIVHWPLVLKPEQPVLRWDEAEPIEVFEPVASTRISE